MKTSLSRKGRERGQGREGGNTKRGAFHLPGQQLHPSRHEDKLEQEVWEGKGREGKEGKGGRGEIPSEECFTCQGSSCIPRAMKTSLSRKGRERGQGREGGNTKRGAFHLPGQQLHPSRHEDKLEQEVWEGKGREGKEGKGGRGEIPSEECFTCQGSSCIPRAMKTSLSRKCGKGREGKGREGKGREGKGREGKGREGKGREGKGREGKGREGKGREGKGREGKEGKGGRGEIPNEECFTCQGSSCIPRAMKTSLSRKCGKGRERGQGREGVNTKRGVFHLPGQHLHPSRQEHNLEQEGKGREGKEGKGERGEIQSDKCFTCQDSNCIPRARKTTLSRKAGKERKRGQGREGLGGGGGGGKGCTKRGVFHLPGQQLHSSRQEDDLEHGAGVALETLDAAQVRQRPDAHRGVR